MFNLREAGRNKAIVSGNQTAPTKTLSTWRIAGQSDDTEDTGETGGTSAVLAHEHRRGHLSFREIVGVDEFDVELGRETRDVEPWDEPHPDANDVEQPPQTEAYEMDATRATTSAQ